MTTRTVSIIYRTTPHYRIALYEDMRLRLNERGIRLRVLSGAPISDEALRRDVGQLSWGERIDRRMLPPSATGAHVEWQSALRQTRDDQAVIVEDATRLISNWAQLLRRRVSGRPLVALWGHAGDLLAPDGHTKGGVRRLTQHNADHYFAYTGSTANRLEAAGVSGSRITVLNNTVDTTQLRQDLASVSPSDEQHLRTSLGIAEDGNIALFVGGLYEEKRLRFLVRAADEISSDDPHFHLLVLGTGPQEEFIASASQQRPWLHHLGPQFGFDKAVALRTSRLILMPGAVGLVAVDALVAGTPIVTTADSPHGPEIDYIRDGDTGFILPEGATPSSYARAVVDLMGSRSKERETVAQRGMSIGERLTIEDMSESFCTGIQQLLTRTRS